MEEGPSSARDLSGFTGLPLPTVHRLLRTLVHEEFLERTRGGAYRIGARCRMAAELERNVRSVPAVREILRCLGASTRCSAYMAALIGDDDVQIVQVVEDRHSPQVDWWVGAKLPAHATALGKCILAALSREERAIYLDANPPEALTRNTIVDIARLEEEMDDRSLHRSEQEYRYGVASVAARVRVQGGIGAVGVTYSSTARPRLGRAEAVLEAARRLSAIKPNVDGCVGGDGF